MHNQTNQFDVDIAYIRAKAMVATMLALGGIAALVVGALVMTSGIATPDSAAFKLLGIEVSAQGIGAVILASSVCWAFCAYKARPQYARHSVSKNSTDAQGRVNSYIQESSTMLHVSSRRPE